MAANPLDNLREQIASATELPSADPYVPSDDPLYRLRQLFRGDDEPAANENPAVEAAPRDVGSIDALVGREVLDLVASAPLSANAREEAVRRLVMAMQNPAPENLRSVLRVLLSGNAEG